MSEDKILTNTSKTPLLQLVGRYSRVQEGQTFIDESFDMHVIAIDEEDDCLFVDFDSCPEWMKITKNHNNEIIIAEKYLIDPETMIYRVI
ncbi:MAG: hypothetical protein SFU25_07995 [Candidatus Caenarcaniphilales bacterium]|nr:hypothetical protein [Candidatus Caenarcaniphilales bacterium]